MPGKKPPAKDSNPLGRIQEFYRFMVEQKLDVLEYDHDGLRVRLARRRPAAVPVPVMVNAPVSQTQGQPGPSGSAPAAARPAGALAVKSPMMGIFYRASSPSSPPFVKTGDRVKKGQVLFLIEAMKVFNEVKADFDCVVLEILLENGKPVKAGQEIILVQKP